MVAEARRWRRVASRRAYVAAWRPNGWDTTPLLRARNGTLAEFALELTVAVNRSLIFTLHEVYRPLAKTGIEGPAGVEAKLESSAAFITTAQRMTIKYQKISRWVRSMGDVSNHVL